MYTSKVVSTPVVDNLSGLIDTAQRPDQAIKSTNLIDLVSVNMDNNFNSLLAEELDILSLTSNLQSANNKLDSSTLRNLQKEVDEFAILTQVVSKSCSSIIKSINELVHIQ